MRAKVSKYFLALWVIWREGFASESLHIRASKYHYGWYIKFS